MKSPDQLSEVFRTKGLKVTPQRRSIFAALGHLEGSHPTADAVYAVVAAEQPTMSLKTVYQTLNDLVGMGELGRIDPGLGATCFDTQLGQHHHMVCTECGALHDIVVDSTDELLPADAAEGFTVTRTEIVFRGRCASCAEAAGAPG